MKAWQHHDDFVLSNLCEMIVNRQLLKVKIKKKPIKEDFLYAQINSLKEKYNITEDEAKYFVFQGEISNQAYTRSKQNIKILYKSGKVEDVVKASDQLNLKALSKKVTKHYICYPKQKL